MDDEFQKGLRAASEFVALFIMPKCTKSWEDDEPIGQRELNETFKEISEKILALQPPKDLVPVRKRDDSAK